MSENVCYLVSWFDDDDMPRAYAYGESLPDVVKCATEYLQLYILKTSENWHISIVDFTAKIEIIVLSEH